MKFLLGLVGVLALGFVAQWFLPYWVLALVGLLIGLLVGGPSWLGFLYGFTGGILLWGGMVFWVDVQNNSLLSSQLGELFTIGGPKLLMLTALLGGLLGGLGALAGAFARLMFAPPKKRRYRGNKYRGYVR